MDLNTGLCAGGVATSFVNNGNTNTDDFYTKSKQNKKDRTIVYEPNMMLLNGGKGKSNEAAAAEDPEEQCIACRCGDEIQKLKVQKVG